MSNHKNILIFSSEFPPGPGGIGNHAFNLAKALSKVSFKVKVLTPIRKKYENKEKNIGFSSSFEIIYFEKSFNKIVTFFNIYKTLRTLKKELNPIIISSGRVPLIIVGFLRAQSKIAVFHGNENRIGNYFNRYLVARSLKTYDSIIAVSRFSKSRIVDKHPYLRVNVINNGVDFARMKLKKREKSKDQSKLDLITVGTMSLRKGQHNVINALPTIKLKYPDVLYHIVGHPNIKNKLIELSKDKGVEDSIKFYDYLDDNQLNTLLCKCDIFIMLSENLNNGDAEGFGISIVEGNYVGLPFNRFKGLWY